jgi:hypothetical protein
MCNVICCYFSINIVEFLHLHISNILYTFFVPRSTVSPYKIYIAVRINIQYMPTIHTTVVGGLVPLGCEEGRPKAVRDKLAGKGQQQYY